MPADATIVSLRSDTTRQGEAPAAEAPAARRDSAREPQQRAPQQPPVRKLPALPAERAADAATPAKSGRRRWLRWALFVLLPLALIAGAYWYVAGGQRDVDRRRLCRSRQGRHLDRRLRHRQGGRRQREPAGRRRARSCSASTISRSGSRSIAPARRSGSSRNDSTRSRRTTGDMQAQIKQAQGDIDYYDREFHRQQDLAAKNIASQQTFDTARRNLQNAQQKLASLNEQLAAIAANLNGDPDIAVEQHPRYLEAMAQRDEAARQLDHTVVKAPFAGIVTNVPAIAPGKYLQASTTAFYLVASDHVWVDANPKETELTYVRPGQPVTVTVDTYPDVEWHGTVESISPAAAQEFSLLPAQNTSGNWVKVVQRIPMRVRLDTSDKNLPPLRAGNERRSRCRHRSRARLAALPDRAVRPCPAGT